VFAGAALPGCVVGQQTASPPFRANSVYVVGDTAWFLSDAVTEGSATLGAIAYARTSHRWAIVRRDWRRIAEIRRAPASGGSLAHNALAEPALAYGYHVESSEPAIDARYARAPDSAEHRLPRLELVSPSGARYRLGIQLSAAKRRALRCRGWKHASPRGAAICIRAGVLDERRGQNRSCVAGGRAATGGCAMASAIAGRR
jgi:hypothetical protein